MQTDRTPYYVMLAWFRAEQAKWEDVEYIIQQADPVIDMFQNDPAFSHYKYFNEFIKNERPLFAPSTKN